MTIGRGRSRGSKPQSQSKNVSEPAPVGRSRGRGRGRGTKTSSPSPTRLPPDLPPQKPTNSVSAEVKLQYDPYGKLINPHRTPKNPGLQLLQRKDYGSVGRPIRLYTNYYEMEFNSSIVVHHYDVKFEGISEKMLRQDKKLGMCIFMQWCKDFEDVLQGIKPVFDGKNMYTHKPIAGIDKTRSFKIVYKVLEKRTDTIDVIVTPTEARINMNDIMAVYQKQTSDMPHNILSFANIAMGFMPTLAYTSFNRNFFPPQSRPANIGGGVELWSGSAVSVKTGQWKLMLNVDEKHTAFYKKQNLRDFISELFPNNNSHNRNTTSPNSRNYNNPSRSSSNYRTLNPGDTRKLAEHLRGLRVNTYHLGYRRPYRVVSVSKDSARQHKILDHQDNTHKTIETYYREKYQINLQHAHLPCIQVEPKNKNIYIPVELAEIQEGQRCIRALTDDQIAKIIRSSAKKPDVKKRAIDDAAADLINKSTGILQQFGLSIDSRAVQIKGRVLPTPRIAYHQNEVSVDNGQWQSRKLKEAKKLSNWGIICMAPQSQSLKLRDFEMELRKEARSMGITVEDPQVIRFMTENHLEDGFSQILIGNRNISYLFVILPPKTNNKLYSLVKECEVMYGITTQCIRYDTLQKKFRSRTVGNVLLKTNAKLGGLNWEVSNLTNMGSKLGSFVFSEPVMIIGADVTHWSRSDVNKPSIAGVVGTLNRSCSVYASRVSVQPFRKDRVKNMEIIMNFKDIVKGMLLKFRQFNRGLKPAKILYYRDGVSQGQFIQTLQKEVAEMQAACKELEEGYQPKITYINAQKRHHTRFFCENSKEADRSGNIPPGTVVDTEITDPILFDFFLSSHAGIQGTNRPCHYTVLWDDNDFSPDFIQLLTYYLCHTYARCTRSVSYPAPTYYAHLLCARARTMLSAMQIDWYSDKRPDNQTLTQRLSQNKHLEDTVYFI